MGKIKDLLESAAYMGWIYRERFDEIEKPEGMDYEEIFDFHFTKWYNSEETQKAVKNIAVLVGVSNQRELLITYELSQVIDGASPTRAMAEEMVDKFLSNL